jgi:antirestriction protein ArdC
MKTQERRSEKGVSPLYETITNQILEALKRGVVPWRKPWRPSAFPCNASTSRSYRGVNVWLLSLTPFVDHRWLTYSQVQERGGRVKPGEPGQTVVFWKYAVSSKAQEEQEDRESKDTEEIKNGIRHAPLLRRYTVFNAEQVEGVNLAPLPTVLSLSKEENIQRAELMVKHMPSPPKIRIEGHVAGYSVTEDQVVMPRIQRFTSQDSYFSTLFHELAHSTGHPSRLNRRSLTSTPVFGSKAYCQEELIAELGSAYCCALLGLDNSLIEDSASYIDSWLKVLGSDPKMVVFASAQAQRAADWIRGVSYS